MLPEINLSGRIASPSLPYAASFFFQLRCHFKNHHHRVSHAGIPALTLDCYCTPSSPGQCHAFLVSVIDELGMQAAIEGPEVSAFFSF